jgi:hypothetical protein
VQATGADRDTVRDRMERAKIFIPATKTPGFRASSTLKDALKEGWLCSSWPDLLSWNRRQYAV